MTFWKKDKPLPITNTQQISASQQEKILRSAKLGAQDISKIKKASAGSDLLNPNKRISLNKMKALLKENAPQTAAKINKAYENYQKNAETYIEKSKQKQAEKEAGRNKIKQSKTRTDYRARGRAYLKEMDNRRNIKRSIINDDQIKTASSAKYWNITETKTHQQENNIKKSSSIKTPDKQTESFQKLKEKSQNLPDLQI